jgi:hypothetical protein
MKLRTAFAGVGLAAAMAGVIAAPAHASASSGQWWDIGTYSSQKGCVDAGQQYAREGFPYRCLHVDNLWWALEIWN